MKNIFYIFCVFCLLCSPCFSEIVSNNTTDKNKLSYDNYAISALNLSAINNAFKSSSSSNDNKICPPSLCLQQKKEYETEKIPKGTKFLVKSKQDINNRNNNGTKITFESIYPERLFNSQNPSKLAFKGKIVKTREPQMAGNSGLIKINIEKMTVGNVTYPIKGMVTKINDKSIWFNNIKGNSTYLGNAATAAYMKNGALNKIYKDPCLGICTDTNPLIAPLYLLSGAVLQTSNLLLSPVVALFKAGENITIQKNSDFVIKLDQDVFVLKM